MVKQDLLINQEVLVHVRKVQPADELRWRELWDGYTRFYECEPVESVTRHTWMRLMDPTCPVHAIVAESADGILGIANYVIHESTSSLTPVCYLEDLFVAPERRAAGVGHRLIGWLVEEMKAQRWSNLYWHTKETNYRARGLYDQFTQHSGFLRYVIPTPDAPTSH